MGKSLYFKPVKPIRKHCLNVTACQVRQEIEALFGSYPVILRQEDIPQLETLQILWIHKYEHEDDGLMDQDPYGEIIKAVKSNSHGIEMFEGG